MVVEFFKMLELQTGALIKAKNVVEFLSNAIIVSVHNFIAFTCARVRL